MSGVQITSLFALQEVRRDLGSRQRAVLDVLKQHQDMTNSEIAAALQWGINRVTPRVLELRKAGRVVEAGRRRCAQTGRTCIAWKIIKPKIVTPYEA